LGGIAPSGRLRLSRNRSHIAILIAWTCVFDANSTRAQDRGWDFEAYRINTALALDLPGDLAEQFTAQLSKYLQQRVAAAIGPAWSFDVQVASGVRRHALLSGIATFAGEPSEEFPAEGDKLLLLTVRWKQDGYELTAREFDRYVKRWGMPIRRKSRQAGMLGEQLFALAWYSVAPLARLEPVSDDNRRVVLRPRGAELLRAGTDTPIVRPGEVYLPILRRTTRSGTLAENGVQVVPWTYVEAAEADGGDAVGVVLSGNRLPFGIRRQGRVEQIAIALRANPGDTQILLRSRSNPQKPLVGYEVFAQDGRGSTTLIGSSDLTGRVSVRPGDSRVRMLFIKNGGQLLARLPIMPGAQRELEVPLPDDDMRLAAEARLAALREDLVDVVARRNILMARTRQKIEQKELEAAGELLRALDELPGRSQFNLTLTSAARLLRSDDPQIQRRIDQLFQGTQTALAQYLDARPINELHDELRAARQE
jgi:hypothetical protein